MKRLLLAGAAFLGLAASGSGARATLFDSTYSGSLIDFTVPTTDIYQILAFGAQGGSGTCSFGCAPVDIGAGGLGAEIGGDFTLTAGEVLQIAVGGAGGNGSVPQQITVNGVPINAYEGGTPGGGGGGSFVVGPGNTPLVIAGGGGGGGGVEGSGSSPGGGGLIGEDGGASPFGGAGGTGGNGGAAGIAFNPAGGGGGFFGAGGNGPDATGGGAFPVLAGGTVGGGFGGGGGTGNIESGGGGGGGYSGGGGGGGDHTYSYPGGGGGSFDAGIDQILLADFRTGNGEVVITELVPEPATIALLGAGLAGLAAVRGRRLRKTD